MKIMLLLLVILTSCNMDYKLSKERSDHIMLEEIDTGDSSIEVISDEPDIEIDFTPSGGLSVKPGCSDTGKFIVKNVGYADLSVNELDAYASIPADIQIISNYVPLPILLHPGESHTIEFNINQSDNIEDKTIIVAKSNDPDEPVSYAEAIYTSDPGPLQIEEFEVTEDRSADILMVVDNSCSMSEEQAELSSNAELFIDSLSLSAVDYRIAVITTDQPSFTGPVITPLTIDPALELSRQVNVGVLGSSYEIGIKMASDALSPGGMAAPGGAFLRPGARLSIIWISDEDDYSGGTTYTWSSNFWSKKPSPGDVSVWAIIGDPIYGCMSATAGNIYNDLIAAMGGGWSSICSTDWGTPMAAVASGAGVNSTFRLAGSPIMGSVKVYVDGVESFDWVYVISLNSVSFNPGHMPPIGSRIKIEYHAHEGC